MDISESLLRMQHAHQDEIDHFQQAAPMSRMVRHLVVGSQGLQPMHVGIQRLAVASGLAFRFGLPVGPHEFDVAAVSRSAAAEPHSVRPITNDQE